VSRKPVNLRCITRSSDAYSVAGLVLRLSSAADNVLLWEGARLRGRDPWVEVRWRHVASPAGDEDALRLFGPPAGYVNAIFVEERRLVPVVR
jgi:hypothetical protein